MSSASKAHDTFNEKTSRAYFTIIKRTSLIMNINPSESLATGVVMEEKSPHNPGRLGSVATLASLDEALGQLDISTKDADEAFAFLRDHPNAVEIREEAVAILSDPKLTKRLLRKIDFTIIPCMVAVYFLQFL